MTYTYSGVSLPLIDKMHCARPQTLNWVSSADLSSVLVVSTSRGVESLREMAVTLAPVSGRTSISKLWPVLVSLKPIIIVSSGSISANWMDLSTDEMLGVQTSDWLLSSLLDTKLVVTFGVVEVDFSISILMRLCSACCHRIRVCSFGVYLVAKSAGSGGIFLYPESCSLALSSALCSSAVSPLRELISPLKFVPRKSDVSRRLYLRDKLVRALLSSDFCGPRLAVCSWTSLHSFLCLISPVMLSMKLLSGVMTLREEVKARIVPMKPLLKVDIEDVLSGVGILGAS